MHLHALATAVPARSLTQPECWEIARASRVRQRLSRRSMLILQAILCGESGVKKRHFALTDPDRLYDMSADELNAAYRTAAPALAADALRQALADAGENPAAIDALLICSCTGYLCPGVTSYVGEQLGLRADAYLLDVVGHGCGAAVPMMRAADAFLEREPGALVATVAVEICSAAFYVDDDPGVIVSACIFGDGAAAGLWRSRPGRLGVAVDGFTTRHQPLLRDRLRFEQREGKLRNLLHPSVPQLAAEAVRALIPANSDAPAVRLIVHPGGREVVTAVEAAVGRKLPSGREVLADFGNMSSPSVLFVLDRELRTRPPQNDEVWWLCSFGAGFSAHACRLHVRTAAAAPVQQAAAALGLR